MTDYDPIALGQQAMTNGLARLIYDEEFCFPGCCYRCKVPVTWNPSDHRAAGEEYGSFVDENGGFECPDGKLHQG